MTLPRVSRTTPVEHCSRELSQNDRADPGSEDDGSGRSVERLPLSTFWMAPDDVEITVTDGEVTLHGTVDTRTLAELLPRFTQSVPGVVNVDAELAWRVDDRKREPAPAN